MADTNSTLCLCGCGEITPNAAFTCGRLGWRKGHPKPNAFRAGHRRKKAVLKAGSYRKVSTPNGRKLEHVAVAEKALGKPLPPKADVHHVDGNRTNNTPSNLVICEDRACHRLLHIRAAVYKSGGNPNTQRICHHCRQLVFMTDMYRDASHFEGRDHFCKPCRKAFSNRTRRRQV